MAIIEKAEDVESKNPEYEKRISDWVFWAAAYNGGEEFIRKVVLRHERETEKNWRLRTEEAEVFNYSETVVNTFARFVSMANPERVIGDLDSDLSYSQFQPDVDLYGTDYDIFWARVSELAGVYGFLGILVDKFGNSVNANKKFETDNRIYPYYALFTPENIWDWQWQRSPETGRPELVFLKLEEAGGTVLAWSQEAWERWAKDEDDNWGVLENGENPIGKIPFVWHVNYKIPTRPYLSKSDICDTARLQAAITRNLSHGSEVIKYAAFPMMRKPMLPPNEQPSEEGDAVGVTAIQEFDPENPSAKPDWMEAPVKEPIEAIIEWNDQKIEEIYRSASLSTFYGAQAQAQAKSGIALRFEFQQLTTVVHGKANALDESEVAALRLWRAWQGMPVDSALSVRRPNNFNVEDLAAQLQNLMLGKTSVRSEKYKKEIEKKIVRLTLEAATPQQLSEFYDEIEQGSGFNEPA